MPRLSAHCCYADAYSVGGRALIDMTMGHENGIVGCNLPSFGPGHIVKGTTIIVHDNKNLHISEATGSDPEEYETYLWKNQNGLRWKYNHKVRCLTPVVPLTEELREYIRSLGVNEKRFWHNINHSSEFRPVLLKLAEFINQRG